MALTTGLRRGELLGLRWIDVETDEMVLFVRQTLQRVGGKLQIVSPKTHRSARPVPLARLSCAALVSTIRLTADTYGHILPAKARDAADGIDRIMWDEGEEQTPE
ncbi:site-specific integrase [Catellatospora paridis]|uniref:hypothetical protein n=1 Tax=Catellatospora paridis TaxID=1617086 RepID=UPI0018AFD369|nr:hypothetical protein [Catellatospora paridis]